MNKNKIVVVGLIAAISASAVSAQCGNGGFYIGTNVGAKFNRFEFKGEDDKNEKYSKCKPMAELLVGYDHRFGCVVVGADTMLGTMFGKITAKDLDSDAFDDIYFKNPFHFIFMPRIGHLVLPQLELYATAGVKVANWKFRYSDDDWKERTSKKTTAGAVIGAGARYEFTPHFYAKLEYNFDFKHNYKFGLKNCFIDDAGTQPITSKPTKISAHVIKIGVGYRF